MENQKTVSSSRPGHPVTWAYAGVFPGEFGVYTGDVLFNKLNFVAQHGFNGASIGSSHLLDPDIRTRLIKWVEKTGLALSLSIGPSQFGRDEGLANEHLDVLLGAIRQYQDALNLNLVNVVTGNWHRYMRSPGLAEQLRLLSAVLKPAAAEIRDNGLPIGIENHGDYTISDLLELCETTPGLGIFFDTGNCFLVGEQPLPAARMAAPVCVGTHFKDHLVAPITKGGLGLHITGATFGEGDVGLAEIYRILLQDNPDPESLIMEFEFVPDPSQDPILGLNNSKRFVTEISGYSFNSRV